MKIALLEPFFAGSHAKWAKQYLEHSQHEVRIFSLKGKYWKWRMYGGAVSLAERFVQNNFKPDLILTTDMLDLSTFLGLCRKQLFNTPSIVYFHENQITYPWSAEDQDVILERNNQYGFINFTTALSADALFFNSDFHYHSFLNALPDFLKQFPDNRLIHLTESIKTKSEVLHLGMDLKKLKADEQPEKPSEAVILWNHRWEYDKNPEAFFQALYRLKSEDIPFRLIVSGESYARKPPIFDEAKEKLSDHILHFGFADTFEQYRFLLHLSDILLVTSRQDFFGGSTVEAIFCNCHPILPDRLAYPLHIPANKHHLHLYGSESTMYQMLKSAVENIDTIRSSQYADFVGQYDWSILAPEYDQRFEKLVHKFI